VRTGTAVRACKLIQRRKLLFLLIAVLLLLGIDHYVGLSVSPTSSPLAPPSMPSTVPRPVAPSLVDPPRQSDALQVRESADRATSGVAAPGSHYAPVHIELSTGEIIGLGQPYELVVRMDPPRSIARLAFTVSVDPQMLRLRSVRGGDSSSVDASGFITEDGPETGQSTIAIDLSNAMPENGYGRIAVVQFEALASGTAAIIISDLAISDLAATTIPYTASSLTAQVEVLSGPL
jgi:hypothetical protein